MKRKGSPREGFLKIKLEDISMPVIKLIKSTMPMSARTASFKKRRWLRIFRNPFSASAQDY
jgi:hypothetical protein